MEKDVFVLIKISGKEVGITAIEKFNSSNIEIFSDKLFPKDRSISIDFIKKSIKQIEELIVAKVNEVAIIFDATTQALVQQKLVSEKISDLNNEEISQKHFANALEKVIKYYSNHDLGQVIPILYQPFKFNITTEDNLVKSYYELPIGKKAKKLETLFSITTINKTYYYPILEMCKKSGLKISKIYSSSNVSPYIFENNDGKNVSVTLQVEKYYSNLIITNNNITVVTKNLKYNFEDLINKISFEFGISKKLANELIMTEGIITKDSKELNRIIFHKKNISIRASKLTAILKSFIKTLIEEINEFVNIKHEALKNYTLNIIGRIEKIEKLEEYCKSILPNNKVFVNKRSINYLLLEYNNRSIFGLTKLLEKEAMTINYNKDIINTKPNIVIQKGWMKPLYKKSLNQQVNKN